jgi:ribonuclease HIII
MQNFTTTLKNDELSKIHQRLKQYEVSKPANPYLLYFYKVDNNTISIFTSGKLLIQGEDPETFYKKILNDQSVIIKVETPLEIEDYIGCDEVGVGDYFGGLITCAVYLQKSQEHMLQRIGVCDSKNLNDAKMIQMFASLERMCEYEYSELSPQEYNELVKKFKNTHIVKSYLHDLTIKKLAKRLKLGDGAIVVMDQYAPRNTYNAYFKKIGVTPYEITRFETKAENKYLAVAAASIIARVMFLKQIAELSKQVRIPLLLGASNPKIIEQARQIYLEGGIEQLTKFVKIDFATTKKVID